MGSVYITRTDSMTQATVTFAAVETLPAGGTGAIRVPTDKSRIRSIRAIVTLNATLVVTGANYILELGGNAMREGTQEIVVYGIQVEEGAGTVTDTQVKLLSLFTLLTDIPVSGGKDITLRAAYVGTDPGTPFISVTLELV